METTRRTLLGIAKAFIAKQNRPATKTTKNEENAYRARTEHNRYEEYELRGTATPRLLVIAPLIAPGARVEVRAAHYAYRGTTSLSNCGTVWVVPDTPVGPGLEEAGRAEWRGHVFIDERPIAGRDTCAR